MDSGSIPLENHRDNFSRGREDLFIITTADLGDVSRIRFSIFFFL